MRAWLQSTIDALPLPEQAEGWCLGRGIPQRLIDEIGVTVWDSDIPPGPAPDSTFHREHGETGQRWHGRLLFPLRSPRGVLLGVEARTWGLDYVGSRLLSQYLLPEANWNPVFVGLTPAAVQRIWDGGDVWLTEGVFDMGAVAHIVPERDTVLATLRAHVSDRHAAFLKRFMRPHTTVHMVYDNDETGRKQTLGYVDPATNRKRWGALDVFRHHGVHAVDEPYRGGKDPGEIWERVGTEGLRKAFLFNK